MNDTRWMQAAIEAARRGMDAGQTPFGACIARGDELVVTAHNLVWAMIDPTAHAEVQAVRQACQAMSTIGLSGCTIYSTCEPCPMCFAACHWARLSRIVYGASIADAAAAGFNELPVTNEQLRRLGASPIQVDGGLMRDQCAALFQEWLRRGGKAY